MTLMNQVVNQIDRLLLVVLFAALLQIASGTAPCVATCVHGTPSPDCLTCLQCAPGWTGTQCDMPSLCATLNLPPCAHGGWRELPADEGGCSCRCAPGWSGPACLARAPVQPEQERAFLLDVLSAERPPSSVEMRRGSAAPLLPSALGYGRHPFSGKLALPLVQLAGGAQWTDPLGHVYVLPQGAALDASLAGQAVAPETKVWPSIREYLKGLLVWQQTGDLVPSPLSENHRSYDELLTGFFAAGTSLGQTRWMAPLYSLSLPSPSVLQTAPLTPAVAQALQYLGGHAYPARKDLYFTLLDRLGTAAVWRSQCGGLIERVTHLRADVWQLGGGVASTDWVKEQLEISWHTGQGSGQWSKNEPQFVKQVDWVRQTCRGGSSAESDCLQLTSLDQWRNELWRLPVPVRDSIVPLSSLVRDPALRAHLELAIPDYLAQQQARYQQRP